ncbi:MAG: hypothetical protein ACXAAT_03970 [Candidatus Hodarchaeales archaeon]
MSNEQDSKQTLLKDQLAKLESENKQYESRVKAFKQELKKQSENTTQGINQSKNDLITKIQIVISNVDDLSDKVTKIKRELEAEKGDLEPQLDTLLGQLSKGVSDLQKKMVSLSTTQEEDISRIYGEMTGKVNTGLNEIYSRQHDQTKKFQDQISSKLSTIQSDIISTVESENTAIVEMSDSITSSFLKSMDEFKARIKQIGDAKENELDNVFAKAVSESVTRLEIAKEDLLAGIDGLKLRLDENFDKQRSLFETAQEAVLKTINDGRVDAEARIEKGIDRYWQEFVKFQSEQSKTVSNIKENVYESFMNALKTNDELQSKLTTDFENSMKSGFKQLEEQILTSLSRVSADFNKKRERTTETLTTAFEKWDKNINNSISGFGTKTKSKLEETTVDLNGSLMKFFDESKTGLSQTLATHQGTLGELQEKISQLFREIQKGQEKNIEITLVDVRKALLAKQSELITAIASIEPTADAAVETHREIVETKNSSVKKSSTTAFDNLRKQIRSLEQDGTLSIQNIITETGNRLDDAVKESEESTKKLVQGLEDQHKNSLSSYKEISSREFKNQQESIDNYRNSLKERFTTFFSDVQTSTDRFTNQIRNESEFLDDRRDEVDEKFEEVQANVNAAIETLSKSVSTNTQKISDATKQITKTTKDIVKSKR